MFHVVCLKVGAAWDKSLNETVSMRNSKILNIIISKSLVRQYFLCRVLPVWFCFLGQFGFVCSKVIFFLYHEFEQVSEGGGGVKVVLMKN